MVKAEFLSRSNGTSNVLREFKNEKAPKRKESPWSLHLIIFGEPFFIADSRWVRVVFWKTEPRKETTVKKYSYGDW
jgi:hypothetical protein